MDVLDLSTMPDGVLAFDLESRFLHQAVKVRQRLGSNVYGSMRDVFHATRAIVAELTRQQINERVFQSDATCWFRPFSGLNQIMLFVSGNKPKDYADGIKKLGMILWLHMQTRKSPDEKHAREMADLFLRIVTCPVA